MSARSPSTNGLRSRCELFRQRSEPSSRLSAAASAEASVSAPSTSTSPIPSHVTAMHDRELEAVSLRPEEDAFEHEHLHMAGLVDVVGAGLDVAVLDVGVHVDLVAGLERVAVVARRRRAQAPQAEREDATSGG